MAKDNRRSQRGVKVDESIKPKKKAAKQDAAPASTSRPRDASSSRRSSRGTLSSDQTKENLTSTRKSKRLEKQKPSATPPTKKEKSERSQKQTTASPLKRYDRRRQHTSLGSSGSKKVVEESASVNTKSKKEKVGRSLKQRVIVATEDNSKANHGRKRKRAATRVNKALSKRQRIKTEAGDDNDKESQDKSSIANSSSNSDVEMKLKRLDKLHQSDNSKNECSGSKSAKDEDDGGDECSDRSGDESTRKASKRQCMTTDSGLSNFGVEEVNDDTEVGGVEEINDDTEVGVEEVPHHVVQEPLDKRFGEEVNDDTEVGNVSPPSRKSLDGNSTESGTEALNSDTSSSYNRQTSTSKTDPDTCKNIKDHPVSDKSPSSRCKKHGHDETCLGCSKKQRENRSPGKQQELNCCDTISNSDLHDTSSSKDRTTCEAAALAESVEKDNGVSRTGTSICRACKLGGELRYCDAAGCNRGYHLSCLDPPVNNVPLGNWRCLHCVKNIKSCVRVIESIWDTREVEVSDAEGLQKQKQKQHFVKYKDLAHIHNQWVPETELLFEAPLRVENFSKNGLLLLSNTSSSFQMKWTEEWTVPQQLLKKRLLLSFKPLYETLQNSGKVLNYHYEWLVKWQDLDYEQATWESENITVLDSPEGWNLIREYENHHGNAKIPSSSDDKIKELSFRLPTVPAGNLAGMDNIHLSYVKNLHDAWNKEKNNLVFDDQERTMRIVLFIFSLMGVTHPFLLITTSNSLSQWEATFSRIALCNGFIVAVEEGQRGSRLLEVETEGGKLVFQVLLYHVDAFVKDSNVLKAIEWEGVIVDECQSSEISAHFSQVKSLSTNKRLLVCSGPLVVSMASYPDVLSLLDCDGPWPNLSKFIAYECKASSSKFVEFWVPVQISNLQLEQYCSLILSNAMALSSCSKSDMFGALHDILVSNRKCCDHPYIVDQGLQGVLTKGLEPVKFLDVGIQASGKLQFLDLILPEMRKRQLRVLILFQPLSGSGKDSTSIGDILDDFVRQRFGEDSYERVDGGIIPSKKQAALNNFNNKDMGRFIFLLEYRACLPSIKLSSVDTVVIFDSDWNPANDIRALQKIAIDSQSEQIMIFRLYTSWTLEEKILILAEHNITIDSKLQNVSRSTSDALLTWGATYLFNKLAEFHGTSSRNISSEEHLRNEVMEEFLNLVSHKGENTDTSKSIITRVQQSCGTYSKNIQLPSELIIQLPNGEQPSSFWKNLLMGRDPCWKFLPRSNPRQRKRPQYCEESPRKLNTGNDDVGRKRKKTASVTEPVASASAAEEGEIAGACNDDVGRKRKKTANVTEPVASASAAEEGEIAGACKGVSSVPSHDGSQSSPANSVWYNADCDETSLLSLLRLNISKLCEVLSLSEDVKIMVERFLEYVMENFHVNKESDNTLQAFLISLCWIGSELVKHELDRRQSVALAKKHLSFICSEEEAKSLCLKLEPAREMFLCHLEKIREMSFNPQDVKVEDDEMVYSGSDHGDQDSSKRTPTLSRNQIQVECHDRAVSSDIVTSPNVTESGSIPAETVVSHTDLSSASVSVNALSSKLASASIEDQPEGVGGSENHVEVAGANGNEPRSPCTSVKQVDDVAISSAQILERNHEGVVGNHLVKQVDSVRMEVLVADCNEEIARVPDGSRCGEGRNDVSLNDVEGNLGSVGQTDAASKSLSATVSKEKLPEASGQPIPTILESRNDSIQDDEVQGHPSSSTEINNPISINAGIDGLINSEDSSCVSLSASLPAVENQSNTPPACEVVPAITSGGQTTLSAAIPTEPEADNPSAILEAPPQVSSQAATPLGPNLLNMQVGYDNLNVGVSRTPNRSSFSSDPLQAEVEKLREVKDNVIGFHEANKLKLKSDYEKEFAEMVTHLNLKYDIKRQDEEAAFQSKVKEVDTNLNRMVMNKVLAEAFKFKCQDVGPSDLMGRQVAQAGGVQHLHQFPARPSLRPSSGVASSSASQSSGSQQATRLQPPLQVVHHSANLFSNTPTRPSSTSNPSNMPSRSPANPTPTNMPIRSQANPTLTSMPIRSPANNTPIRSPANRTPTSMPIRSPANNTPTSMPGRAPPNINPSTRPSRPLPPPNITPSFRPSRPQPPSASSSSIRIPRVGGEIRAPAPHIRPFRPSTSVAPHDLASRRVMSSQHASSSLPPSSATTFSQASSRMSSQTPPPVLPNHNGHLTQNSPTSLPAASPSPDQTSSQPAASVAVAPPPASIEQLHREGSVPSSLPPMPSISISQTGLYGYSAGSGGKGESGIVLPSADILSMPALGLLMDIDTQAAAGFNHQANMEVSKENGGGDEVVCLSDDD